MIGTVVEVTWGPRKPKPKPVPTVQVSPPPWTSPKAITVKKLSKYDPSEMNEEDNRRISALKELFSCFDLDRDAIIDFKEFYQLAKVFEVEFNLIP